MESTAPAQCIFRVTYISSLSPAPSSHPISSRRILQAFHWLTSSEQTFPAKPSTSAKSKDHPMQLHATLLKDLAANIIRLCRSPVAQYVLLHSPPRCSSGLLWPCLCPELLHLWKHLCCAKLRTIHHSSGLVSCPAQHLPNALWPDQLQHL